MEKNNQSLKKIKLENPIKVDGVLVDELTMRTPKVRDLIIATKKGGTEADLIVNMISNLAEIPLESVYEFDLKDFAAISNLLQGFFSPLTDQK